MDYTNPELKNLNRVLESYGVTTKPGVVLEGNSQNYIGQMPYYMLPNVESVDFTEDIENMQAFEKEDGDLVGKFPVALLITENLDEETQTQFICYGGSNILDANADNQVAGANTELVLASLAWMCENETPVISVESKDLTTTYLVIPESDAGYWAAITCGVIPAAFLIRGFFIWLKRRKQ